jgi:CRISPR-associated protein Cas1
MEAFESGVLDLPDFYFMGDDYRYRFEPEAKQRFLESLRERFNSGVTYKGRSLKWDTVIEQKTIEMGRFIASRSARLDFSDPPPRLMSNERGLRRKVVHMTSSEAHRVGIGKSTLHYLKKRAKDDTPFRIYEPVMAKVAK